MYAPFVKILKKHSRKSKGYVIYNDVIKEVKEVLKIGDDIQSSAESESIRLINNFNKMMEEEVGGKHIEDNTNK